MTLVGTSFRVVRDEGYGTSRLIWHLTHHDSHSLEAVSHSSSSQVIHQAIFPFISYFSHDESLCFLLLLILLFLIYHLICHAVLRWNFLEYSSDSLMSNHLCCLVIHDFLLYIKRLSFLREKNNQVLGLILSSALLSMI